VPNAEPEPRVRFSQELNLEPEPAFRFGSAFERVRTQPEIGHLGDSKSYAGGYQVESSVIFALHEPFLISVQR
jgi:hypothetical protein